MSQEHDVVKERRGRLDAEGIAIVQVTENAEGTFVRYTHGPREKTVRVGHRAPYEDLLTHVHEHARRPMRGRP